MAIEKKQETGTHPNRLVLLQGKSKMKHLSKSDV
jgi:hypothetical protein